jgi:transposase
MDIPNLLLNIEQLYVQNVVVENGKVLLEAESSNYVAHCPSCGQESTSIHGSYLRHPTDLAWGEWPVILWIKVKRFSCKNDICPKQTFAEQFSDFVDRYARKTRRVIQKQQRIGVNVASRVAEQLLESEQVSASDSTINRLIRALPHPETHPIRVLGVDDWAKRKGQRYGTILVDLERRQIVDILEDRTAESLAKWLKDHPGIEIVSRDRSSTYAEGIERGAPEAIQIADRWHLLKNGSDAVYKLLQQEYGHINKRLAEIFTPPNAEKPEAEPLTIAEQMTIAEQQRKERIDQVQSLRDKGWKQKDIARQLNIHPKTVRRYLRTANPKATRRRTGGILDPFKPYILQRWNEGCHNATQLFREIREKGFTGHESVVIIFARQLRQASGLPPRVRKQEGIPIATDPTHRLPTLRTLTWWIIKRAEEYSGEEEKILEQVSIGLSKVATTIKLAREFAAMIRQQQVDHLDVWLQQAQQSGYQTWENFADGIKQDYAAVKAALSYSWSNGPTEGHVNRLKCIKRLMYGRAKDDLLRQRVLWQGKRAFT